jgi:hypothetical protein
MSRFCKARQKSSNKSLSSKKGPALAWLDMQTNTLSSVLLNGPIFMPPGVGILRARTASNTFSASGRLSPVSPFRIGNLIRRKLALMACGIEAGKSMVKIRRLLNDSRNFKNSARPGTWMSKKMGNLANESSAAFFSYVKKQTQKVALLNITAQYRSSRLRRAVDMVKEPNLDESKLLAATKPCRISLQTHIGAADRYGSPLSRGRQPFHRFNIKRHPYQDAF